MKVMADALQNLAVKQLEALGGMLEEPALKDTAGKGFLENAKVS